MERSELRLSSHRVGVVMQGHGAMVRWYSIRGLTVSSRSKRLSFPRISSNVPYAPVDELMLDYQPETMFRAMPRGELNQSFCQAFHEKRRISYFAFQSAKRLKEYRTSRTRSVRDALTYRVISWCYMSKKTQRCPTMRAFNTKGQIVNVYCGQWSCPHCAKLLARLWAWRIKITIRDSNSVWFFWTLTLRSKYRTAAAGYAVLPTLWDTLRKAVQRHEGHFTYMAFVEGQPKRGNMPHFHIITTCKPWKRIKDIAWYAGFGHQAVCIQITGPMAGSYVAKYATKQNPSTPRGFRRVRTSQDIAPLPPFQGEKLIVPYRHERPYEYALRVAETLGLDPGYIYEKWSEDLIDGAE